MVMLQLLSSGVEVGFALKEYSVGETAGQVVLQLTKTGQAEIPVQLAFNTQDGSAIGTLLKMGRYYSTTVCYYWDMSVK